MYHTIPVISFNQNMTIAITYILLKYFGNIESQCILLFYNLFILKLYFELLHDLKLSSFPKKIHQCYL